MYILVVLLAVAVRLVNLGSDPLSNPEALLALKALDLLHRVPSDLGAQPGYALPTGLLFFLFGPENGLARLLPAVLGGILAGLPYFYRNHLGRVASLLLALGLALDPGMIALSRQATGVMVGISLLLMALTAWIAGRPVLAGSVGALALISGPAAILNALTLAVAVLIGRLLKIPLPRPWSADEADEKSQSSPVRLALIAGLVTVFLTGTVFLFYPSGIGAMAGVIPASLESLFRSFEIPFAQPIFALLVYQPIAVIFGLIGGVQAWIRKDGLGKFLTLWFLLALLMAVLPPGRQVWNLAWALVPLLALAARAIAGELEWDSESGLVSAGFAVVVTVLLSFIWFQLASLARAGGTAQPRYFLVLGVVVITAVSAALVGLGWSWPAARRGLVWGLVAGIGIYSLSASFKMVSPLNPKVQELWYSQPSVAEGDLLLESLSDFSEWATGRREAVDLTVTQDLPSLRWALRNFDNASFGFQADPLSMPSTLITNISEEPDQPAAYRGADFIWHSERDWGGALPPELLRWIVFRESPLRNESLILWARNDLFPGGEVNPEEGLPLPSGPDDVQ